MAFRGDEAPRSFATGCAPAAHVNTCYIPQKPSQKVVVAKKGARI